MRAHVFLCFVIADATALRASTWVELRNARCTVTTDSSVASARELVTQLEQLDGAIAHSFPTGWKVEGPLRLFLFRNEREFAAYRDRPWQSGLTLTSGHTAPVLLIYAGAHARETLLHEYVHALVKVGGWKMPPWFEEGLAEFYGHSRAAGKTRLHLGGRIPEYVSQLKNVPISGSLLQSDPRLPDQTTYYAASWAMVHMLLMEPGHRPLAERLLENGEWAASLPDLCNDLRRYLARPAWPEETVETTPAAEWVFETKPVPPAEAQFLLAALLLDAGKTDAARASYQKLSADHPAGSIGAEARGLLALSEERAGDARRALQVAVDAGSPHGRVWLELALLRREAGDPWTQIRPLLERAAALNAEDFEASFRLGVHESDDGNWASAVLHLRAAAKAAPARCDVWHAYAFALSKAGPLAEAKTAARRAMRLANSPEEERMASALLTSFDSVDGGLRIRQKPQVVTSPAWDRPVADAEIAGRFVELVCGVSPAVLKVEVERGKVVELVVRDPREVKILSTEPGESSIELKCGSQDLRPINVFFRRADGTVLELKFPQVHDLKRF